MTMKNNKFSYVYNIGCEFMILFVGMPSEGIKYLHLCLNYVVNIRITDTVIGLTIDQINRLEERYFSTKGKKGKGLGPSCLLILFVS